MLENSVHRGGPLVLEDRLVILVDDGLADPMVVSAGIASLRARQPARFFRASLCLARSQAPSPVLVDRLIALRESDHEPAIICDELFIQTTWDDVRRMVKLSASRRNWYQPDCPMVSGALHHGALLLVSANRTKQFAPPEAGGANERCTRPKRAQPLIKILFLIAGSIFGSRTTRIPS
jgi:hypothetical protein